MSGVLGRAFEAFVLPATDDPWASLAAIGIRRRTVWPGMLATAPWILVVVNSVLAGVVAGLLARLAGAAGFVASLALLGVYSQRQFRREMEAAPVAFAAPSEP